MNLPAEEGFRHHLQSIKILEDPQLHLLILLFTQQINFRTALPSGSIQDTDTVLAVILITKKRSGQPKNFITCLLFIETHLDGSVVIPWVVIKDHGLKDYARLKSYERPLKITRQLVQLLAICYGTPTKHPVSKCPVSKCPVTKTPIFKTSNHKTTIIKTAINKMSVYKTSIYKTAVYKMSVYKISLLVNITNRPFSKKCSIAGDEGNPLLFPAPLPIPSP